MIQLYRPGTGILHRMPAGVKLAGLAISALALSLFLHDVWTIGAALLVVCALYAVAGLPLHVLGAEMWRLRWLVLILALALWIFVSPVTAWISTAKVVTLVLLASLLTLTTRMGDLLAVLRRLLTPLRRLRVDVDAVSMTVSLTIAMIPVVAGFADQIRDAQRARGVRLGIRSVVPLLVRTLRHADDVGDALTARGLV
ncbi:energy-coupling factor transporter transmembrane protein EcfT [Microbacterium sp. SD291]|uniref:energy-coupling factor transporter transmembrane component T family protein n=1 Tax=Microbacterium sp. SD291 TaxID=2782007 RepID=UPI001A96288A|nr:energy-coupling factor transporter transmembrane protein EcfT [Microbacterium sp. SD291]MBO0979204.1 energy-coupling factor transporter transmembrane protein EcfT [Microbacterium sp. SD291]